MQFDTNDMSYVAKGRISHELKQKTFYISLVAVFFMGGGALISFYYGQSLFGTITAGVGFLVYYYYFGMIEKRTKKLTTQLVAQWNSEQAKHKVMAN